MNRIILRTTTAVAAVTAAALLFPAVATAAPVSAETCAEVSSEASPNGWGNPFEDEPNQAGTYVADEAFDADGALKLTTVDAPGSNPPARSASYHSAGQLELTALTGPLTVKHQGSPASWQIRVTKAATGTQSGFATLVYAGAGATDVSESSEWWSTKTLGGTIPAYTHTTLAKLKQAAGPSTVIDHYGISIQTAVVGETALIDDVTFNGCTTNFAKKAPAGDAFGSLSGVSLSNLIPLS
ncbi:hypothetical protein [Nocardia sp. 348MFTsu5.1]|uniref:hypothetical protein n=1 Tax=Nocardia sp. 348MFTsu5.1 TaxID=1172185 RepID=UPI0003641508|nr:hypothetical protein [Nocardia sp. 348MFTsu5.1]